MRVTPPQPGDWKWPWRSLELNQSHAALPVSPGKPSRKDNTLHGQEGGDRQTDVHPAGLVTPLGKCRAGLLDQQVPGFSKESNTGVLLLLPSFS